MSKTELKESYKKIRKSTMTLLTTKKRPKYNYYVRGFGKNVMKLIDTLETRITELEERVKENERKQRLGMVF